MLHCLNTSGNLGGGTGNYSEMTVLERQRKKWQQQDDFSSALGEVVAHSIKPDPAFQNACPDLTTFGSPASVFDVVLNSDISRSCSGLERELLVSPICRKETLKKRKTDTKKVVAESNKRMRVNVVEEVESKTTEQTGNKNKNKRENSVDTNSKGSEIQNQKNDYIHVRARRGQATDSHSLAERVRREKISERMKYLQDLVPGCNKIAGKAGMLDEIINYVQSLQRQVEFLSMKLAAVNPRLDDFNIDELFLQSFPTIGMMQQDIMNNNPSYHQFNSAQQQLVSCYGGLITQDMGLRRNISTVPVSLPDMFLDSSSSCFNQQQHILPSSTWEGDFQSVAFDQQRSTSFPSHHPFTGLVEASNLKMEM